MKAPSKYIKRLLDQNRRIVAIHRPKRFDPHGPPVSKHAFGAKRRVEIIVSKQTNKRVADDSATPTKGVTKRPG